LTRIAPYVIAAFVCARDVAVGALGEGHRFGDVQLHLMPLSLAKLHRIDPIEQFAAAIGGHAGPNSLQYRLR
jgi:hypothetical protein